MLKDKPVICLIGGEGKMGHWFTRFFEARGASVTIVDNNDHQDAPFRISQSDIVIVCVPISQTAAAIKLARKYIPSESLLSDITSLKTEPVKEMSKADESVGVLGMHPLFGPLVASVQNQIVVFSRVRSNDWVEYLQNLFEADGAQVIELTPEEHDRRMAMVQSATHMINIAFIRVMGNLGFVHYHNLSTPPFRLQNILAGRILGGDARLYSELAVNNPHTKEVVEELVKEVENIRQVIGNDDQEQYEKTITEAAEKIKDYIPVAKNKSAEILSLLDSKSSLRVTPVPTVESQDLSQVLTLGPVGTFSHFAAKKLFSDLANEVSLEQTISQVFSSTLQNENAVGLVPIENSTQGIVQETLDNLLQYPLQVVGSYTMPIHLSLLGRTDDLEAIKIIRSHPQPLEQARNWLATHYPEVKLEATTSSTQAILSTADPTVAFIANRENADTYGLKVLAENIEDKKNNRTQFYCLSVKERPAVSRSLAATRTLLLLTIHDGEGVLRDILNAFADRGLNLSRLDSHRSEVPDWDYYFFLEVEALPKDPPLQDALKEVENHCYTLRVLGII